MNWASSAGTLGASAGATGSGLVLAPDGAGGFGGTIAHGFLTLSLLSHLSEATFSFSDRRMGVNYGLNRVRFTSPVPVGSRVRARFTLQKFERIEDNGVQVTWTTVIEREGAAKPALVAEWIGRHYY